MSGYIDPHIEEMVRLQAIWPGDLLNAGLAAPGSKPHTEAKRLKMFYRWTSKNFESSDSWIIKSLKRIAEKLEGQ